MAASTSFLSPVTVQKRRTNFQSLKRRACAIPMAPTMTSNAQLSLTFEAPLFQYEEKEKEAEKELDPITDEHLDQWIKDSVSEIVRNIGEAPFLVRIFSKKKGNKLERETATPDTWHSIKKKWTQQPDGIILVDQLNDDSNDPENNFENSFDGNIKSNKKWGVVVQGRGMECGACYILNTCRVGSPAGFCTHFCLARAQCFGDPFELQLRNAWLNGRNSR